LVGGLRADNEERLTQALREIHDGREMLRQAGYQLAGVDMDLSPVHRLIVHLEKVEDADEHTLRHLLSASVGRQTISALLSSMIKGESLANKIRLTELHYCGLVIHVGPTPSMRLCWSTATADDKVQESKPATMLAPATAVTPPPPLPLSTTSSFFEPRPKVTEPSPALLPSAPPPLSVETSEASTAQPAQESASAPKPQGGSDWKRDSLDRFKKMPDFSKYRR
jgi:hypothetical protein